MPAESTNQYRLRSDWRAWCSSTSMALALSAILSCIIGWIGLYAINKMSTRGLTSRLTSDVDTCVLALEKWLDEQRRIAVSWASDAGVRAELIEFMNSPLVSDWKIENVLVSDELARLRTRLGPVCEAHDYVGFVVIDRQGRQVAALLDNALGNTLEPQPLGTLQRVFQGDSVVTLPFVSSIPLPDERGKLEDRQATMLVAAPVRERGGQVIAALAFRLRTTKQFTDALESSRPGDTGETYAFNKQGILLSDSRFNDDLRRLGLIPADPDSRAVLEFELRDPGGNLTAGFRPSVARAAMPLTRMAASATRGENDVDVAGYRDYRGVPVVGAWRWLSTYEFGVTRELDVAEAYAPLVAFRQVFLSWLGLFTAALIASAVLHFRRQQTEHLRVLTQDELSTLTNRFQAVLDSATQVSIIATDMSGVITPAGIAAGDNRLNRR